MKCEIPGCYNRACETHEIFYGRGKKYISVKHGLQLNICRDCHENAHLRRSGKGYTSKYLFCKKIEIQQDMVRILADKKGVELDFYAILRAVNTYKKIESKQYLEELWDENINRL